MRNVVEVTAIEKDICGFTKIRKISAAEYVNTETGEIGEYDRSENKAENIRSLKMTFRRTRDLINNSFEGAGNELHLILTYRRVGEDKKPMTDTKRLYIDFVAFWKRFKRKYGHDVDYLSVIEPQEDGTWHSHLLVRFNDRDKVYIPNHEIEELWRQGWTKTKAMNKVDNMGAYLTAYLTDVELTPENALSAHKQKLELKVIEVEGKPKAFIKGARVHYYPSGMNIVRHSKGIKPPKVEKMTYKQAKKIVRDADPDYSSTTTIYGEDDKLLNEITYEQYNLKRVQSESSNLLTDCEIIVTTEKGQQL